MIEVIIALINSRLTTLDLFKDIKGLCEQIQKEEGEDTLTYPAQWCEGNYTHIDDLNNWEEGLAYHRQIGENTEEAAEEAVIACDEEVTRIYPMRVVCLIPKDKLTQKNNDQYIDDKLATNVANALKIVNNRTLEQTLNAGLVSVDIVSTQKDRYIVFEEEFTLPKGQVPGFEFAFFFIDYTISITATQSCFDNFDCDGFVTPQFCDVFVPVVITDAENPSSPISRGSGLTYECLPASPTIVSCEPFIDDFSCQQLNDNLTQAQREIIQRVQSGVTGQTVSTAAGDDGDNEIGRGVNWDTESCDNPFGNTDRFTDSIGAQNYDGIGADIADYVIDNRYNKGWQLNAGLTPFGTANYAAILTAAAAHDNGTFSNFRLPNWGELMQFINHAAIGQWFNYMPLSISGVFIIVSGTDYQKNTAQSLFVSNTGGFGVRNKTSVSSYFLVRDHY